MNIRDASSEDIASMLVIEQTGYQYPWSDNVFQDCFKPNYYCLLAVVERQAIGFAIISNIVGEAHLLNICIHSDYYRQGYATKLLHAVVQRAADEGCDSLLLEVRESNHSGIGLYRKFGFSMIGSRKNYYPAEDGREDALMFQLSLKDSSIDHYA